MHFVASCGNKNKHNGRQYDLKTFFPCFLISYLFGPEEVLPATSAALFAASAASDWSLASTSFSLEAMLALWDAVTFAVRGFNWFPDGICRQVSSLFSLLKFTRTYSDKCGLHTVENLLDYPKIRFRVNLWLLLRKAKTESSQMAGGEYFPL